MADWRENVRKVEPYVPGEQPNFPDMIKLNTNENPYPPSGKGLEAMRKLDENALRMYPDPKCEVLRNAIAKFYGVKPEQVFTGVGSDDVLAMSFQTFFDSKKPILFPDITYSFYDVWAEMFRIPYILIPLNEKLEIDPKDYLRENGGIVIANPNAPTGTSLELDDLEKIIAGNPASVVIVDEAYVDFGGTSALQLLEKYDNLLVVQTFSKSRAMAGMRIGFAIGSEEMICRIEDIKQSINSYTMNRVALEAGAAVVEDREYFEKTCGKIIETREWAKQRFTELGFTFGDSRSNFVFVTHKTAKAKDIFMALREAHIFVRYFNKPRIDNYLRITIGTKEQMEALFAFLEKWLGENGK